MSMKKSEAIEILEGMVGSKLFMKPGMDAMRFAISALSCDANEEMREALKQIDLMAMNDHYLNTELHFQKINNIARQALANANKIEKKELCEGKLHACMDNLEAKMKSPGNHYRAKAIKFAFSKGELWKE